MHPSIRHYSLQVERELAHARAPRVRAIALTVKPSMLDRFRASFGLAAR